MQPITGQFDPAMFILSRKSRKKLIIHIGKSKCVSIKSLNYLTLWFVNICMHSKKRMGSSIDFCSQSKSVEQPVQPVFPDIFPFPVTVIQRGNRCFFKKRFAGR